MSTLRRNAGYQKLFWSSGITNLGDGISAMALPWIATIITGDPFLIACVAFGQRAPWLVFSIPAGALTDRMDRKRAIVTCDLIRTALMALIVAFATAIPEATTTPAMWIAVLTALAFALGSVEVLRDNSAQTMLPSVVPEHDLEAANGNMWSVEHVTSLIGPPIAGVLIAVALPLPFVVHGASFLVAALLISRIQMPKRAPVTRETTLRQEMAEGWHWLRQHPVILSFALMLSAFNFASMMAMAILVLFAQEILGLGAFGHGMLLACGAAGGAVGGVLGPKVVARLGGRQSLMLALGLNIIGQGCYVFTANAYTAGLAEGIMIFGGVVWNIVTVSYRQRHIPDALLGRVNAIYRFFGWGSLSIAALASGTLASALEHMGREVALRAPFALGCLIICALFVFASTRLRFS